MKLYLELYFKSSGTDPMVIIKRMKEIGFDPVVGEYDFMQEYEDAQEYCEIVEDLVDALDGTDVRYRLITRKF